MSLYVSLYVYICIYISIEKIISWLLSSLVTVKLVTVTKDNIRTVLRDCPNIELAGCLQVRHIEALICVCCINPFKSKATRENGNNTLIKSFSSVTRIQSRWSYNVDCWHTPLCCSKSVVVLSILDCVKIFVSAAEYFCMFRRILWVHPSEMDHSTNLLFK